MEQLRQQGLDCPIVGGGGTGTFALEAGSGVYTEIQAGSYVFMDADYARNLDATGAPVATFRHALFVLATVMSAPRPGIAVLDAGLKALAVDSGLPLVWQPAGDRAMPAPRTSTASSPSRPGRDSARSSARSCAWCPAIATRRWTATTGMSASVAAGWSACGRSRRAAA